MEVMRIPILNRPILNLLILLLEEPCESRTVVPAVALGPEADPVVHRLVMGKLSEPGLGKVPKGVGGLGGAVGRMRRLLARKGAQSVGVVPFRGALGELSWVDALVVVNCGAVCRLVVGEADLVWLVNVQHVDMVVPTPRIGPSRLGVLIDDTRAVFA